MPNPNDLIARIRLYSTAEGGRNGPTPKDVFNCVFRFGGENFDCRLFLHEVGRLYPGVEAVVPIAFVCPQYIKARLKTGDRFQLWEAGDIADGEILHMI